MANTIPTSEYIPSQISEAADEDQSTDRDDNSSKTGSNNMRPSPDIVAIAEKENELVVRSKKLMLLTLFISAIGMGMATYYVSIGTYEDSFMKSVGHFFVDCL